MRSVLLALLALPAIASAEFGMMGVEVPIERLIAHSEKAVRKSPNDADLHFQLARLYSMRFANKLQKAIYVELAGNRKLTPEERLKLDPRVHFAVYNGVRAHPKSNYRKLEPGELKDLVASLNEYRKANTLNSANAIAKLGFAWMQELAAPYASQVGATSWLSTKAPTTLDFRNSAANTYRELYALSKKKDLEKGLTLSLPDDFPAAEAAKSLLRLFELGVKPNSGEQADLKAHIAAVDKKPKAITPIVFPLSQGPLFNPSAKVDFDLAGDGIKRQWPWITSNAAFLAWDPKGTGKIESGRQLFGNATFWMMYRDGYQALSALDDNLDGWLSGLELKGIVAWRDSNDNGKSDKGEVVPIVALGITAIRVRADGRTNGMLSASRGLKLANGGFLPTYDWKPTSWSP